MPRRGRPRHPSLLTPGEQRVLKELRNGGTNAEIAVRLGLSPETVKTHVASMLSKLDLRDRRELAAFQPQEESRRRRILGAVGAPLGLSLSMRPLVWAGAGLAGAASIAVAGIFIAATLANGDQPFAVPPDYDPKAGATPSPSTTPQPTTTAPTPTATPTVARPSEFVPHLEQRECKAVTVPPTEVRRVDDPRALVELLAVSDGSSDSLLLEWNGGPPDTTSWQYRTRMWISTVEPSWLPWADVPNSDSSTRAFRLTGLAASRWYEVQVRPVVRSGAGGLSNSAWSFVARVPLVFAWPNAAEIVEGDGQTQWHIGGLPYAIVIPDGMRLTGGAWRSWLPTGSYGGAFSSTYLPTGTTGSTGTIYDLETGSSLAFSFARDFGWFSGCTLLIEEGGGDAGPRDVEALFDQIVASLTRVPHPTPTVPTATPTATATPTTTPAPATVDRPLVYSKGEHDALYLEWDEGPADAAKWQYRQRHWEAWEPQEWGAWTDIPNSGASTRSYHVTGLTEAHAYDYEVRPVVGTTPGTPSRLGEGVTAPRNGIPSIYAHQVVEGDGKTEWRIHAMPFVITIPDGMRLVAGQGLMARGAARGVWIHALGTSFSLFLTAGGTEGERDSDSRDVEALFDQIVASVTVK